MTGGKVESFTQFYAWVDAEIVSITMTRVIRFYWDRNIYIQYVLLLIL
jgi:hypothetical protein